MKDVHLEKNLPYLKMFIQVLSVCVLLSLILSPFFQVLSTPESPSLTINSNFNIPAVPHELPYRHQATVVLPWVMLVLGLVGLLMAIPDAVKRKSPVPVLLVLSGAAIAIPEVFFDVIGCVLYPFTDKNNAFTIIGRQMPWFIVAGWQSLAILFITPMAVTAFYGLIAMPAWIVVNADYSWLVTQAGGLLTVIMGCFGISLVIRFLRML